MTFQSAPLAADLESPTEQIPVAHKATQEESIAKLLATFRQHTHFVVTSHARPDGDAIGSVLAMAEILEQLGCVPDVILADPAPIIYKHLPRLDRIRFSSEVGDALSEGLSLPPALLLECDGTERTGLTGLDCRLLINIDHHLSGRNFGAVNWIDPSACAVAAMVYRIAVAAQVDITPAMATCLYTSILSDTGAFTYPSTNSESFAIAHDLILRGANPSKIARDLYFSSPLSKVRLLGKSLDRLQVSGNLAWSWVTVLDLEQAGATPEDCEGIVGQLIGIDCVEAAFFLREQPDGTVRLSIRSKGTIDVARVAEAFGGGGHVNASGCTLLGPVHSAVDKVLFELRSTSGCVA